MKADLDKKIVELTLHLQDKSTRLETYEKLEAELDNVVMKAAALPGKYLP
jgi:hypothetical protein